MKSFAFDPTDCLLFVLGKVTLSLGGGRSCQGEGGGFAAHSSDSMASLPWPADHSTGPSTDQL